MLLSIKKAGRRPAERTDPQPQLGQAVLLASGLGAKPEKDAKVPSPAKPPVIANETKAPPRVTKTAHLQSSAS